jgi:D-cysteine desulfhydrase
MTPDRVALCRLPTPLERARRHDDLDLELWFKRDDRTDVLWTGNKARKLELVLGEALAQRADTLVVGGGPHSNLCRVAALAGASLGMRTIVVMGLPDPSRMPAVQGNLLLELLCGAELRRVPFNELLADAPAVLGRIADEERRRGRRPFAIPLAASSPLGVWGYVQAVEEVAQQLPASRFTFVYPVASGGTGAGLLLGIRALGLDARALGVVVTGTPLDTVRAQIARYIDETRAHFGLAAEVAPSAIELVDETGGGYGAAGTAEIELARDVATREGVVLDLTYTVKAMAAVRRLARAPGRPLGDRVVFVHTGGVYGLFSAAEQIAEVVSP